MKANKNNYLTHVNLKPGAVINILNISGETLRYWRTHLDPRIDKRRFSGRDLLMYSVFKLMIRAERIQVQELKDHNWKQIFKFCSITPIRALMKYALIYNPLTNDLFISDDEDKFDTRNNWLHCVEFKVAKKQLDRLLFRRTEDNIIYLNQTIDL